MLNRLKEKGYKRVAGGTVGGGRAACGEGGEEGGGGGEEGGGRGGGNGICRNKMRSAARVNSRP